MTKLPLERKRFRSHDTKVRKTSGSRDSDDSQRLREFELHATFQGVRSRVAVSRSASRCIKRTVFTLKVTMSDPPKASSGHLDDTNLRSPPRLSRLGSTNRTILTLSCLHPFRANFGVANLNGATLSVAHLNGADLCGAKLIQADLLAPVVRSVERLTEPPDRFN